MTGEAKCGPCADGLPCTDHPAVNVTALPEWANLLACIGAAQHAEELLVEAHEKPDSPLISAMFFVGFLALLLIEEIAM